MPFPERQWLRWARREAAGQRHPALRVGIGDDAALFDLGRGWQGALTTDLFIEGVHFLRRSDPAPVCGRRCATRALSDLAAMGAAPVALLVSVAFPADADERWRRGFQRGVRLAAASAGAALAGGDLSASPMGVAADIVGLGRVRRGRALLRSGARPGDLIFVSGILGLAARGRALVHAGRAPSGADDRTAVARHRHPQARWALGMALADRGLASAAIDISDGLSTDLNHLCDESGVGATIDAARLPLIGHPEALALALHGGEDYELLFAAPARRRAAIARLASAGLPLAEIGTIERGRGVWLRQTKGGRRRLRSMGWEHFRSAGGSTMQD
ncbi:MAG: thiamine-phosphate kinase [Terriglobales bacterium]